jgi:hypothetical protein
MKLKKYLLITSIVVLFGAASFDVVLKSFRSHTPSVGIPLLKVFLFQKYASFWDDAMVAEGQKLQEASENERIDFYFVLLVYGINIELNGQASMLFHEMVGSDNLTIRSKLLAFQTMPSYQELSESKRKSIEYWIDILSVRAQEKQIK